MSPAIDWAGLMWEARGYVGLEDDEPVPRDELVATAEANGYSEREIREALADTDAIEATDGSLEYVVESEDTAETPKPDEGVAEEVDISTATPGVDAVEPAEEAAVEALRDVLRFYNARLDDTIDDHTEDGDHPERPTTAREYFRARGWADDTIDDLLLGWAPARHTDQLVAYLHDRGHSRETILATGAVGESDSGRFYTTFSGRYVLPYFDADGDPAYAIARCTGGEGGGGAGYDGHPGDGLPGKYAKLRHTDERVPFDEPIYGLDTLEDGEPVVVAEGIADAITAREAGYSVLSPVAREFKEEHFAPLVDALEAHDVGRVTVVGDADDHYSGNDTDGDVDSIGAAVDAALVEAPAGLSGALRTADGLTSRAEYLDVRVAIPPALGDLENDLDEFVGEWGGSVEVLLRAAKPAEEFDAFDTITHDAATDEFDDFDTDEYEPSATEAEETTDDIRDLFVAIDKLDAQRVADDTIVDDWLEGRAENRTFRPTWAPSGYSGTANYVDSNRWVDDGDRGGYGGPVCMAAIDAGLVRDTRCPDAVEGETWFKAVAHLRDLGYSIPKLETTRSDDAEDETDTGRDLLELDVVVEPANALAAAAAVEPDDLDEPLPELEREDVDDVAIAVALADGTIDTPEEFPDDGRYTDAYYRARDHYGAPLPKYLDNSTLEERADLLFAALDRLKPEHILDRLESDVTVEDPSGEAIAKIDPTWEESESGERILAGYGRGFLCTEHSRHQPEGHRTFDPLQVAALEHDLVGSEFRRPSGEAFKRAYTLLREEYGAPLPKWRATVLEHVAVLPPAANVLGDSSADRSLESARKQTEALLRDAVDVRDRAQLLTNIPGTGKTFGTAIVADETPTLYVAQRNELKQQMEEYAAEIRADEAIDAKPTVRHLPILCAEPFDDDVVGEAVEAVREDGFDLLRDRDALLEAVDLPDEEPEDDEDDVEFDRPTCPVADGEYGDAWALAVQTARALRIKAAKIHEYDTVLFGEPLPCQADGEECPYSLGWEVVRDPDDCADILVGSPGHAYVDSATTYFDRGPDGERVERHRAVVVDEFLNTSYFDDYGDRYLDFATWLARSLVGIDTREDLGEADLDADTWVNLWLDGDGDEYADTADVIDLLDTGRKLCEARRQAGRLLERGIDTDAPTAARLRSLSDALETLRDDDNAEADLENARDTISDVAGALEDDADTAYATGEREDAGRLYGLADDLTDVLEPLSVALDEHDTDDLPAALEAALDPLPVGGDLADLLDDAVDVLRGGDGRDGLLDAAVSALEGGREGCRELAIYAEDGYAHPDAWALLAGAIARDATTVRSEAFAFDGEEGGTFKHIKRNGATILADKNQHGAVVVDQPAFTDITGEKCPVIGLDATGRPKLWKLALGRDVERRDIHDSDAERRGFLRDNGYAVVQTTNDPLPYHSDPSGKNFGEDLELVKTVAEEYTGTGPDAVDDKKPAVISTLKVLNHLEDNLDPHVDATVNYENMKGSDALGEHQVAVILGSCHYGDAKPELWGLLAGDDVGRGGTRGDTLDYGSDVANGYLRYMREDTTMQAVLRAGRNDDDTVIFVHTGAVRDDLPTVDEGAVLSAHSKGTLAVAEAAKEYRTEPFTVRDLVDAIDTDERAVGRRQVQNIVADLRDSGYLRVLEEGGHGIDAEYQLDEEPGLADVELPEPPDGEAEPQTAADEKTRISDLYTWNFVRSGGDGPESGVTPPTRATIPATDTAEAVADGVEPPG